MESWRNDLETHIDSECSSVKSWKLRTFKNQHSSYVILLYFWYLINILTTPLPYTTTFDSPGQTKMSDEEEEYEVGERAVIKRRDLCYTFSSELIDEAKVEKSNERSRNAKLLWVSN